MKGDKSWQVSELELVDDTGGQSIVSVWGNAFDSLSDIPDGEGVTCVGCSAMRDGNDVKLHIWPGVHARRGGDRAQSLTGLDASQLEVQLLTATFVPTYAPIDID